MGNRREDLDDNVIDLLNEAEMCLTTLKGLGHREEINEIIHKLFPKPTVKKATNHQADTAFVLGGIEYRAGTRFLDWYKQPLCLQSHWRRGWLSQAQECAVLKDVVDVLFENAADHQYWLEAAALILKTDAEHTKVKSRRLHLEKVVKGLMQHIRALRKITGQEEITVTTETLEPKEGLTEETNGGAGSVASYNDPVAAG